jgi:hypothetical protein
MQKNLQQHCLKKITHSNFGHVLSVLSWLIIEIQDETGRQQKSDFGKTKPVRWVLFAILTQKRNDLWRI